MKKIFLLVICLTFVFMLIGAIALAQEEIEPSLISALEETIDIPAQELGVGEPTLLPDSKWYFIKNWGRALQGFFTFNKVKKAQLKAQFSAERLLEIRALVVNEKTQEKVDAAIEKYQEELSKLKTAVDKIKDTASTSDKVNNFLEKFTQQQVLHQAILDKLENQVATSTFAKIEQARERHIEEFQAVMEKLQDRAKERMQAVEELKEAVKNKPRLRERIRHQQSQSEDEDIWIPVSDIEVEAIPAN